MMKAMVYRGPEQMIIEESSLPEVGPEDVLIRVAATGICGSELEGYKGHSSIRIPPLIMGHEFAGNVISTGEKARRLAPGAKVVVNPLIACGECVRCKSGQKNICLSRKIIGIHQPGAFAEYVVVPQDNVFQIPAEMSPIMASLAEPLAVCVHAVKLGLHPLEPVLIYGAGPIGLLSVQVAFNMGAKRVLVVDKQPSRLAFARELGADTATPAELVQISKELFPTGIETIIECVGMEATREQAMQIINPGGKIVMVGLGQDRCNLDMNRLVRQEITVSGSYTYSDNDFAQAIELLIDEKIAIERWTSVVPFEEGPAAFRELAAGRSPVSKMILAFEGV